MEIVIKIKQIIKNCIEKIRRIKTKDDIFSFKYNNETIYFYLPYKKDYVQQQILFRNTFYENNLFKKINKLIKKDSTFLDIGSNIENHIIYYTKILNAKKVYGFEPQKDVFKILKKNIKLNNVSNRVDVFNIGLGSEDARATIKNKPKDNRGATSLKSHRKGEFQITTIDNIKIKEKIDFIKIDTEGFEKEVLIGGIKTIKKNMPIVWVEIDNKNNFFVFDYFKDLNYKKIIRIDNYGNHIFIPKK